MRNSNDFCVAHTVDKASRVRACVCVCITEDPSRRETRVGSHWRRAIDILAFGPACLFPLEGPFPTIPAVY